MDVYPNCWIGVVSIREMLSRVCPMKRRYKGNVGGGRKDPLSIIAREDPPNDITLS